ncbi:MAG: glycoside hydrolase family 3 protein [Bacteroidota bacterium]|nr:glycoside hydrolase family 3 protein [Bacteroidota bacterium]
MQARHAGDSLDIKLGQMLMVGFRGLTVRPGTPIAGDIRDYHLGGVILFDFDVATKEYGRNIASPMQLLDLTSGLQDVATIPLFIAVDQEGGKVARLKTRDGFPHNVSHAYIGKIDNDDTTRYYTDILARSLTIVGANLNFAPVLDLNVNPSNPVIGSLGRSIGADPELVTRHAALMIEAYHSWGVLCAVKHFPGHGSSVDDSHLGFVDVSDTWSDDELEPYQALIERGLPDMVMTAHIYNSELDETYPATLSAKTIDGLLREELGYEGVVISDDLMMKSIADHYGMETAIREAVLAGVDILLFANNTYSYDPEIAKKAFTTLKALVQSGAIPASRIDQAFNRIMTLKNKLAARRAER